MDIILIFGRKNRTLNYVVNGILLAGGILLAVLVVVYFVYNLVTFTRRRVDASRLAQLRTENEMVRREIARIERDLDDITGFVDSLDMVDRELRMHTALEPIRTRLNGVTADVAPGVEDADLAQTLNELLARAEQQSRVFADLSRYADADRARREHTPSVIPVQGWFMAGFGPRLDPFTGLVKMHEGIDIAAPVGTPIVAPANGTVAFVGDRGGFGLTLEIDHGYRCVTVYCHCQQIVVTEGQTVQRGQTIAYVGNTGKSTGPHLHYEVRVQNEPRDPLYFMLDTVAAVPE